MCRRVKDIPLYIYVYTITEVRVVMVVVVVGKIGYTEQDCLVLWDGYQQFISFTSERVRCYTQMMGECGWRKTNKPSSPSSLPQLSPNTLPPQSLCIGGTIDFGIFLKTKTRLYRHNCHDTIGHCWCIHTHKQIHAPTDIVILSSPAEAMTFFLDKERKNFFQHTVCVSLCI